MLIFVVIVVQKLKMPILKNNKYKSSQKPVAFQPNDCLFKCFVSQIILLKMCAAPMHTVQCVFIYFFPLNPHDPYPLLFFSLHSFSTENGQYTANLVLYSGFDVNLISKLFVLYWAG